MRRKNILFAILLTALLTGGCGRQQNQMKYIGAETAKQAALDASGLSSSETESLVADLRTKKGTDYYQISFTAGDQNYQYDIDALTGVVIDSRVTTSAPAESQFSADTSSGADANAGTDASADTNANIGTDVSADTNANIGADVSADTNANVGADMSADTNANVGADVSAGTTVNANAGAGNELISADDAKARALAHAGLTADQVTFRKSKLDYEKGRQVYDMEFYTADREEYDYEIDAYTGEIVSYDYEAKDLPSSGSSNTITEEEAKKLALSQVPGASDSDIRKFKTDHDDGRMEYDGTIIYDGTEYEFEIDAYSGAIRSWEAEPIDH